MTNDKQRLNYILFLIASSGLVTIARAMSLTFLVIQLQQKFGLGAAMIGILLGVGPLLGAISAIFAGSLSDRIGRKTVLVFTMFSMALALVGLGTATTLAAFCLAQIVSAIAIAVYEPISRALMSDICPQQQRLKLFSWRYTAANVGWAIGPLIGIYAGASYMLLFLVAGAIYAVLAMVFQLLPVPQATASAASDHYRPVPLRESIRAAIHDPRLLYFLGGGTLLVAIYGQWSATIGSYLGSQVDNGMAIYAYISSVNGAVVLIGNPFARRFIERFGALKALVIGCLFFLIGELGFMVSGALWGFALSMVVFTIGEILVVPSEYMLVDGIANDRNRGSYFGAHSFSTVGNSIGSIIGGTILGAFGGVSMFLLFAAFAIVSAILFSIGTRMPPPNRVNKTEGAATAAATPAATLRGSMALAG